MIALAGAAQWVKCRPTNGKVASLVPSQGTCLGCGPGSLAGGMGEATSQYISHTLLFPPSFSLSLHISPKTNKMF